MPASAYDQLVALAREIALLTSTEALLSWDQETYMPAGALDHRARQLAYLNGKAHGLATSNAFRRLLDKAEGQTSETPYHAGNLRELRRQHERAARLPQLLVQEESAACAHAKAAWTEARRKTDFTNFAPHLQVLVDLARRKADLWGYTDEPYDALLETYERGARTRAIAELFDRLRPELAAIAQEAVARSAGRKSALPGGRYPVAKQQQLNAEIAASIGFDLDCGRIDTTAHPFCTTLGPRDVRLTTRYDERDFTSSLFGVLHEAGHGLYEQGLPPGDFGLPSGTSCSLGIHESQSRLWENHVGRSRPFWEKWLPRARELFPQLRKVRLNDFLRHLHRARYSYIRVEADEATYDLHILLRFDIERRLILGELPVAQVPEAWNAGFRELFGMTPPDAARGCLQDIHWSMGGLGYFATYTLGNLNAAQLFATARRQRRIAAGLEKADYAPLLAWLREKVHNQGGALLPGEIMANATGKPTQAQWHLKHLRARFLQNAKKS